LWKAGRNMRIFTWCLSLTFFYFRYRTFSSVLQRVKQNRSFEQNLSLHSNKDLTYVSSCRTMVRTTERPEVMYRYVSVSGLPCPDGGTDGSKNGETASSFAGGRNGRGGKKQNGRKFKNFSPILFFINPN
jgi:hypothetical protein